MDRATAPDSRTRTLDHALELAARDGWAHLELPASEVLTCDPKTIQVICDLVTRLTRAPRGSAANATPNSHHRDRTGSPSAFPATIRRACCAPASTASSTVQSRSGTANKLQASSYDLVICWHPLAGLAEADEFHVDSGRLCVLTTRHRHACILVGRRGDRELLEGLPPSTPAWPGIDDDAILGGWDVHRRVFDALEPTRIALT